MIQRKKLNYNTNLRLNIEVMCSNNPKDYWGFMKRLQSTLSKASPIFRLLKERCTYPENVLSPKRFNEFLQDLGKY